MKVFDYEDDAFPAIDWRVVVRGDLISFHANVDRYDGEPFDPNAGEFTLTLTRDDVENWLRHTTPEDQQ